MIHNDPAGGLNFFSALSRLGFIEDHDRPGAVSPALELPIEAPTRKMCILRQQDAPKNKFFYRRTDTTSPIQAQWRAAWAKVAPCQAA